MLRPETLIDSERYPQAGGVLAYGPRFTQVWPQRARLVIKIFRGAKPADIPVEQPTNFELVSSVQAAKAIGHEVPAGLVWVPTR